MKTVKLTFTILLCVSVLFVMSCNEDQDAVGSQGQSSLNDFTSNLNNGSFITTVLESKLPLLNKAISEDFFDLTSSSSDKKTVVEWNISKEDDNFVIKQNKKTGSGLGSSISNADLVSLTTCPSGQASYKQCASKGCTEEAVAELVDELGAGETITMKRNFFNVTICGTKSLVDRTTKNNE